MPQQDPFDELEMSSNVPYNFRKQQQQQQQIAERGVHFCRIQRCDMDRLDNAMCNLGVWMVVVLTIILILSLYVTYDVIADLFPKFDHGRNVTQI